MAKNVTVFCDGTGNDRTKDEYQTNVAVLCDRVLESPQRQVVYYEAGVGTEMGDLIGKATGTGISKNVQQYTTSSPRPTSRATASLCSVSAAARTRCAVSRG